MPPGPTLPRIIESENTPDSRTLVAAQSRMYSDAKILLAARLGVVVGLAIAAGAVAVASESLRVVVGAGGESYFSLFLSSGEASRSA